MSRPPAPPRTKILIISCSTGAGHVRIAQSLFLTCQKKYPDAACEHIDLARYANWLARFLFINSYNILVKMRPKLFGYIFNLTNSVRFLKMVEALNFIFCLGAKKLNKKIQTYQPDVIISTHFFTPFALSKKISTPLYQLITDYYTSPHKIWLSKKVQTFFTATAESEAQLTALGFNCLNTGLPIGPKFFLKKDAGHKEEIRKKFNINNNYPVILFMPAASGKINILPTADKLLQQLNKINVMIIGPYCHPERATPHCHLERAEGEPRNLRDSSTPLLSGASVGMTKNNDLRILPRTKHIDELMRLADIIITKAGASTLTECLYLQKPMIIINPIAGQEDENARYFIKNNWAARADNEAMLIAQIQNLLAQPIKQTSAPVGADTPFCHFDRASVQRASGEISNASEKILKHVILNRAKSRLSRDERGEESLY